MSKKQRGASIMEMALAVGILPMLVLIAVSAMGGKIPEMLCPMVVKLGASTDSADIRTNRATFMKSCIAVNEDRGIRKEVYSYRVTFF